jgi:hypothetical protein
VNYTCSPAHSFMLNILSTEKNALYFLKSNFNMYHSESYIFRHSLHGMKLLGIKGKEEMGNVVALFLRLFLKSSAFWDITPCSSMPEDITLHYQC